MLYDHVDQLNKMVDGRLLIIPKTYGHSQTYQLSRVTLTLFDTSYVTLSLLSMQMSLQDHIDIGKIFTVLFLWQNYCSLITNTSTVTINLHTSTFNSLVVSSLLI